MSAPARASVVVALGGALYLLSFLLRSSIGLIEPSIERDYGLDASKAGMVGGALFIGYALAQIPLGVAVDRWGARPVLTVCGFVLAIATLGFTLADNFAGLLAARLLMGASSASIFAGLMSLIAQRVPTDRFAEYAGLETSIGRSGLLLGAAPLAALIALDGWPRALQLVALLLALATIVFSFALRSEPRPTATAPLSLTQLRAGLVIALQVRGLGPLVLFQGCASGMLYVLLGAWGGPWLIASYGFDAGKLAAALSVIALAYGVSALLWGGVARWVPSERGASLIGGALLATLLTIPATAHLPEAALWLWLVAIGLASGCYPLMLDQLRRCLPPALVVRGITLLGVGSMSINAALMSAGGMAIDLAGAHAAPGTHPPQAFNALFALLATAMAIATVLYARRGIGHAAVPAG